MTWIPCQNDRINLFTDKNSPENTTFWKSTVQDKGKLTIKLGLSQDATTKAKSIFSVTNIKGRYWWVMGHLLNTGKVTHLRKQTYYYASIKSSRLGMGKKQQREAMVNVSNYSLDLRLQGSLSPGMHTKGRVWVNNICVGMIIQDF